MHQIKITTFTQLIVWQKGHKFVLNVYEVLKEFPKIETYALADQLRRAVVSITSNIAEGFYRRTTKEKCQYYNFSLGSLAEVQNQLLIARDLQYINNEKFNELAKESVEIAKLLNSLITKVKKS